jgi:alkyl sulfatase BDS1-like metallo-beta-lactamase superfamily hydrolase
MDRIHKHAKQAKARVFLRLGYRAENASWRRFYLSATTELGAKTSLNPPGHANQGALGNVPKSTQSAEQCFDLLAVRLNVP